MTSDAELTEAFQSFRPRLFGIAYRMLETRAEAEDVLQEAWIRLRNTVQEGGGVDSVEGFLVTTVTRLCIDHLKSARVRRERYVGPWLPEPLLTPQEGPDREVERAEALSMALLRVLDQLDPLERAVFLLREVFGYPYARIAQVVDRREDHCRQIARRARQRVRRERPRAEAGPEEHQRLLTAFLQAAAEGDLAQLEVLLADDVLLVSDGGGKAAAARRPVQGKDPVARFMAGVSSKAPPEAEVGFLSLNGLPSALVTVEGRAEVAVSIDVVDGRIARVFMVRNPDKLKGLVGN